ncbi:MAG: hypothetical protein ACI93G_001224 [Hyphomonas sp.]
MGRDDFTGECNERAPARIRPCGFGHYLTSPEILYSGVTEDENV